jgi:hypothetical protein
MTGGFVESTFAFGLGDGAVCPKISRAEHSSKENWVEAFTTHDVTLELARKTTAGWIAANRAIGVASYFLRVYFDLESARGLLRAAGVLRVKSCISSGWLR